MWKTRKTAKNQLQKQQQLQKPNLPNKGGGIELYWLKN